jgi:hypothetical protein
MKAQRAVMAHDDVFQRQVAMRRGVGDAFPVQRLHPFDHPLEARPRVRVGQRRQAGAHSGELVGELRGGQHAARTAGAGGQRGGDLVDEARDDADAPGVDRVEQIQSLDEFHLEPVQLSLPALGEHGGRGKQRRQRGLAGALLPQPRAVGGVAGHLADPAVTQQVDVAAGKALQPFHAAAAAASAARACSTLCSSCAAGES